MHIYYKTGFNKPTLSALIIAMTITVLCACSNVPESTDPFSPIAIEGDWSVSTLPQHDISTMRLEQMLGAIQSHRYAGISSILIAYDNHLVFEAYPGEFSINDIHSTRSAGKSVTSALVGIAIDKGFIPSTSQTALTYFPEYEGKIQHWDTQKNTIELHHLLTMTSGVKGNEDAMYPTDDWIKFYFDQPLVAAPGNHFSYATSGVVVLGNIITRASGLRIPDFANTYLFGPLNIDKYKWPITNSRGNQGLAMTGGGLHLRPRDMLKFGQLYSNQGRWHSKQIISAQWVERSLKHHATSDLYGEGYGYLWRIIERQIANETITSYEAWGNGGQFIMIFPSLSLVTVFTGENYGQFPETEQPFELLEAYILPTFMDKNRTAKINKS